jgi:hypothetical protein
MLGRLLAILFLAGGLTGLCFAQTDSSASVPNSTSAPSATGASPTPTPKKVWTNDDVQSAKPAILSSAKRNTNPRATPTQTADPATVQRIRKNLEKLQEQVDDIDKKLKTYKEFLEGEPVSTGAREINKGVNRVPVDQQMTQLQDKRKQLEAQMSDLYDEARKKGIDPGELR